MTITIGWWIIPAVMTLATVVFGFMPLPRATGNASMGNAVVGLVQLLCAIAVTLIAWLIWALLR